MPTGWAQANGFYRNLLAAAGEDAVEMDGVVEVNPSLFQLRSTWNGGVDPLTVTPTWADQVTDITEVGYGWEGSLPNGNVVSLLDPQLTKLPDILDDYSSGGAKIVQTMPVNQIVGNYAGGAKWLAEQHHLGGAENWVLPVQPDESGNPDVEQPDWAISSIPAYHVSKANNIIGGDCCRVGKRNHFHRPFAAFWTNQPKQLKGVVAGELAIIDGKLSKLYPMAEMAALIAVSDLVSIDVDIGYTTIGASSLAAVVARYFMTADPNTGVGWTSGAGSISSVSVALTTDYTGVEARTAVYKDDGTSTNLDLVSEQKKVPDTVTPDSGAFWAQFEYSSPPNIAEGLYRPLFQLSVQTNQRYDALGIFMQRDTHAYGTALPASVAVGLNVNATTSMFFTLEGAAPGGTPDQSSLGLGVGQDL